VKILNIVSLSIALFSFNCATTKKHMKPILELNTAEQVLKYISERKSKIKTMSCEGRITLETSEESNSGSFKMTLKVPDSIKIDLHGPFGIRAGSLSLTRENYVFYNPSENSVRVDRNNSNSVNPFLPIEISFDDVINAIIGSPLLLQEKDSIRNFFIDGSDYVLIIPQNEGYKEYKIDRETLILNTFKLADSAKGTITYVATDQYDDEKEVSMPMFVRVVLPTKNWSLTIAMTDYEINTPVNCSITFPKSAKYFRPQ